SVWVKVEVGEVEGGQSGSENNAEPVVKVKKRSKKNKKPLLSCEECDYTTQHKNCLKFHIISHRDENPLSCDHCGYTTKYPTALNRHRKMRHQLSVDEKRAIAKYKCDFEDCEYVTFYRWNLNAHKRKHKLEKQHKCPKCDYQTAYRHNFIKHGKIHNEGVYFKCDKCPFVTKFEGHITRHLAKIHNEVSEGANKCDLCDFSTKIKWRLNTHKQRSLQKDIIKCDYCEFETMYMCESKKHRQRHFGEIYKNKSLQIEQETAKPPPQTEIDHEMPYQEDHETSKDQYLIDPNCLDWNSIQVLESDDKERPFMCLMCNYTSKFKAAVQRHFQRHHTGSQNRPYKCCNCDFSTKTKDQIALHNKRSKSDKVLTCTACDFVTFFKCQHAMHQKCHYTFKCSMCTYSCKQKYDLQKHYSVMHMGKGLKCSYCDYKAARKESLLCHEAIHTGNKPFKCAYCKYMSVRRSLLDIHVKRYHSEIKTDVTIVSDDKIESLKVPLPMLLDTIKMSENLQ
ncbi:zinc finger protein 761-like, partial [Colias croceus]|uniref:zinc finger protein 761-like n=1 Tax=Colias crocea TaxID=72248 RepID=UPI001E27B294